MRNVSTIPPENGAENGLDEWQPQAQGYREFDLTCLIRALRKEYGFSGAAYLASVARVLRHDLIAWAEDELAKLKN
jgi:hypothetical protein